MFAFASVHTTWKLNCALYNELKQFDITKDIAHADILNAVERSRAGLNNNRAKFIFRFIEHFKNDPKLFSVKPTNETWTQYRDRLESLILGLGPAKTAFALELIHPLDTDVICVDTHVMQLYGLSTKSIKSGSLPRNVYPRIEGHWRKITKQLGISPVIIRSILWDDKQNRPTCRYWTYVFDRIDYYAKLTAIARNQGNGTAVCGHSKSTETPHDSPVLAMQKTIYNAAVFGCTGPDMRGVLEDLQGRGTNRVRQVQGHDLPSSAESA
jgi:thermostable 8-oxoguanine DNA glycosylase